MIKKQLYMQKIEFFFTPYSITQILTNNYIKTKTITNSITKMSIIPIAPGLSPVVDISEKEFSWIVPRSDYYYEPSILTIKFKQHHSLCNKVEKQYIIYALNQYYKTNTNFKKIILASKRYTENINDPYFPDIVVSRGSHYSGTDKQPHFNINIHMSYGTMSMHVYWNYNVDFPKIYSVSVSMTI